MCGIGGIIGRKVSDNEIDIMKDSLKHRGPDGYGFKLGNWGLSMHTRLSIVDLRNIANQPFIKYDNSIITTHNGEIYNYDHLLSKLSSKPELDSFSDSEIIPFLYNDFGILDTAIKLEGMFAISLLDLNQDKFYLLRDVFGIKPLYYFFDGDILIYGSEIKAILPFLSSEQKVVDSQMAYDFMSLGYIVEPNTFYQHIKAIPQGHILQFDLKKKSIEFIDFSVHKFKNYSQSKFNLNEFDAILKNVILDQSRSDVHMGCFLSGGIDSTLISGYFSKVVDNPCTFNIAFDSKDRDESKIAETTANYFGTNHYIIKSSNGVSKELVDILIKHFDQPFGDLAFISSYVLTHNVSKKIKVVLSGDGGDEFVAGYPKFRQLWLLNNLPKFLLSILKLRFWNYIFKSHRLYRIRTLIGKSKKDQIYQLSAYLDKQTVDDLFLDSFESPSRHFLYCKNYSLIQNITINQKKTSLVSKMLPKVDRMSMLNGLEVRVPMLDTLLTNKLFYLSDKQKLSFLNSKIIFRKLLKRVYPGYTKTKKVGFDYNYNELEKLNLVDDWIRTILESSKKSKVWELLSRENVETWVNDYLSHRNTAISRQTQMQIIFNVYVLLNWYEWV